jgi:hypothetical protein
MSVNSIFQGFIQIADIIEILNESHLWQSISVSCFLIPYSP